MCGDPQALICAKNCFQGIFTCPILKITVFENLKILILDNFCFVTYPQKNDSIAMSKFADIVIFKIGLH